MLKACEQCPLNGQGLVYCRIKCPVGMNYQECMEHKINAVKQVTSECDNNNGGANG